MVFVQCIVGGVLVETATKPQRFALFEKVHNPLRLPRKTKAERQKVVRTVNFLSLLTWKCASRHNGRREA